LTSDPRSTVRARALRAVSDSPVFFRPSSRGGTGVVVTIPRQLITRTGEDAMAVVPRSAQALNEVLWEDTPTQNFPGRFAVHDLRLGGRQIRKGDLLILGLAAANHDPLVRPEPQTLTGNQAYMSFSNGEHGCPYAAQEIAKVIARPRSRSCSTGSHTHSWRYRPTP
jgi:cytochrome P450